MGILCFTPNPTILGVSGVWAVLGQRGEEELWEFCVMGGLREEGLGQPHRGFGLFGVIFK